MCGITGILQIPRAPQSADLAVIGQMTLACVIADLTRTAPGAIAMPASRSATAGSPSSISRMQAGNR